MRISQQADQEIIVFDQIVTLSSGVQYNHREILKKINKHKRGMFYKNEDADDIFWALGMPRATDFQAKLDIDTRHFQVEGYGDYNVYQSWSCNIRFRKWSRDTQFAEDLDDYGDAASDFGSGVIKLTEREKGGYDTSECDLMKLWFDPTIKSFYDQTKIELHELEEHIVMKKKGWNNIKRAWVKAQAVDYIETNKSDLVNVVAEKRKFWERVGYYDVSFYKNENLVNGKYLQYTYKSKDDKGNDIEKKIDAREKKQSKWKFMHTIHSGTGDNEVVVFAEEIKPENDLYIDIHIGKYEDRWMRIGVYERLFGLQKLINEVVNYNRESQQITSLLLLRTKNKRLVGSNILQEAESGLITDADLEQIGITNTFFTEFIATVSSYEQKADALCKTPDMKDFGDQKTFRGLAAMINKNNSSFKKSRDRICSVISKMLIERILPEEIKEWNKEKSLEIAGFDIDARMFDAIAHISKLNEWLLQEHAKGNNPTQEEQKMFADKLQKQIEMEGRRLILPENFYDFDFGLSINAVGESENKEQMNDAYFNIISWILANPAVSTIPAFREYCEKNGVTPFHLTIQQVQQVQQGATGQAEAAGAPKKDSLSASIDTQV